MDNSQKLRQFVNEATFTTYDFDETLAQTHLPSPNGLTVERAYELIVDELFGAPGLFEKIGGLQNRAPLEIAAEALKLCPLSRVQLLAYYERNRESLSGLVPEGKGVDLALAYVRDDVRAYASELIARGKLLHLLRECGTPPHGEWPMLALGAGSYLRNHAERHPSRYRVILSSGHDIFIKRFLKDRGVWDEVDGMQTDDDMRGLNLPHSEMVKPNRLLIDLVLTRYVHRGQHVQRATSVHYGDDLVKDGELARNANVRFGWYNPEGKTANLWDDAFEFRDWNELTEVLR